MDSVLNKEKNGFCVKIRRQIDSMVREGGQWTPC